MKRNLVQSVKIALALSLLLAAFLATSETFHLTQRSPYFVGDLGGDALRVIGWYVAFAAVAGLAVGAISREPRTQAFVLSALYYTLVSIKILWIDADLLSNGKIALGFVLFTGVLFASAVLIGRRFALPIVFPVVLTVAYTNVCLGIASGWALAGGRLGPFLLSPRTLAIVVAGGVGVVGTTVGLLILERRRTRWGVAVMGGVFVAIVASTVATMHKLPAGNVEPKSSANPDAPDLYILSFDALRSDMLQTFITSHPDSHLARISRQASTLENVVSHGLSTDAILANNTFAKSEQTNCTGSVPDLLVNSGYFTAMLYGGTGRRFEGSVCYQYYFAGDGDSLVRRYSLPALAKVLVDRQLGLRHKALRANQLLEKLEQVAHSPRPLFAYIHFLELHAPYVPEKKTSDQGHTAAMKEFMRRCYVVACDVKNPSDAEVVDFARRAYVELLDEVDRAVGRTLEIAKQRGREFVIVITADHGELFGEHGGFAHGGGFVGELLDIPFVVYDSRRQLAQRRCELMFSSDAVWATAAGLNGVAPYSDHAQLQLDGPLGHAMIDKGTATVQYEIANELRAQSGTWRNIHREPTGTLPYPIARCD